MNTPVTAPAPTASSDAAPVTTNVTEAKGSTPAEAAQAIEELYEVGVDKELFKVNLKELKRGYSHQQGSNKRMQAGIEMKKQADQLIARFETPDGVLEYLKEKGVDPYEFMESKLYERIQDEMMDPKDKKIKEVESKLQKYEREKEEFETTAKEKQVKEYSDQLAKEYQAEFIEALEAYDFKDPSMVSRMANKIQDIAKKHGERITGLEAAELVNMDLKRDVGFVLNKCGGKELFNILGEEGLKKVREYDLSRLKNPTQGLSTPKQQGEINREPHKSTKPLSFYDKQALWDKERGR